MKKMYTTKVTNTGGRSGEVFSADQTFKLKVAAPGSKDKEATNPEQLFAAGYAACFNSALELVMQQEKTEAKSEVSVTVTLYQTESGFQIGADIEGSIEGKTAEETKALLAKAHQVCPYSKATRGNIEVTITAL